MRRLAFVSAVTIALLSAAAPAAAATETFAYLDPATGTLIVSAIIGGFAAIAMLVKRSWYRIKGVFTGKPAEASSTDMDSPAAGKAENPGSTE